MHRLPLLRGAGVAGRLSVGRHACRPLRRASGGQALAPLPDQLEPCRPLLQDTRCLSVGALDSQDPFCLKSCPRPAAEWLMRRSLLPDLTPRGQRRQVSHTPVRRSDDAALQRLAAQEASREDRKQIAAALATECCEARPPPEQTTRLRALDPAVLVLGIEGLGSGGNPVRPGDFDVFTRAVMAAAPLFPEDSEHGARFGHAVLSGLVHQADAAAAAAWVQGEPLGELLGLATERGACPSARDALKLLQAMSPRSATQGALSQVLGCFTAAGTILCQEGITTALVLHARGMEANGRLPSASESAAVQALLQRGGPYEGFEDSLGAGPLSLLMIAYHRMGETQRATAVARLMQERHLQVSPAAQRDVLVCFLGRHTPAWPKLMAEV